MGSVELVWKNFRIDGRIGGTFVQKVASISQPVEMVCKNLWVSLWRSCGKILGGLWESWFSTKIGAKVEVFHVLVEKFCRWICTWFTRGSRGFYTVSTALITTIIKNII